MEHVTSSSNGLHGTGMYASVSDYAVDRPLPLTKNSHETGVSSRERSVIGGTLERQQVRESMRTINLGGVTRPLGLSRFKIILHSNFTVSGYLLVSEAKLTS